MNPERRHAHGGRLPVAGESENPVRVRHEQVLLDRLTPERLDALENLAKAMLQKRREPARFSA
jgi:hypothetical protein